MSFTKISLTSWRGANFLPVRLKTFHIFRRSIYKEKVCKEKTRYIISLKKKSLSNPSSTRIKMVKVEKKNDINFVREWSMKVGDYKNTPSSPALMRAVEITARKELNLLRKKVPSRKMLTEMLFNMNTLRKAKHVGTMKKVKIEILYQVALEKANERVLRVAQYNERKGSTRAERSRAKTMRKELTKTTEVPMISRKGGSVISATRHFTGAQFDKFNGTKDLGYLFPDVVDSFVVENFIDKDAKTIVTDTVKRLGGNVKLRWHFDLLEEKFDKEKNKRTGEYESTDYGTKSIPVLESDPNMVNRVIDDLAEQWSKFVEVYYTSKEVVVIGLKVTLTATRVLNVRGSSYIKLPAHVSAKKCCVNIENKHDNNCFWYSLMLHLHRQEHLNNGVHRANLSRASWWLTNHINEHEALRRPIGVKEIPKIEKELGIPINLFGLESVPGEKHHVPVPLLRSKMYNYETSDKCLDLLLLDHKNVDIPGHYVLITDINRFLSRSKDTSHDSKRYYCRSCIHGFCRQELLDEHLKGGCLLNNPSRTELPPPGSVMKFKNYGNLEKSPIICVADFESFLDPLDLNVVRKGVKLTHEHKLASFRILAVSSRDPSIIIFDKMVRADGSNNVAGEFIKYSERVTQVAKRWLKKNQQELLMSDETRQLYNAAETCYVCGGGFTESDPKVRDHDHFAEPGCCNYRGAAHSSCNVKLRVNIEKYKQTIFFHNLRGYDSHLIIRALADAGHRNVQTIFTNSRENALQIRYGDVIIQDSLQLITASLDTLVANIARKDEGLGDLIAFDELKKLFPCTLNGKEKEEDNILVQKGVFPYTYMTGPECFKATELPKQADFFNDLSERACSDKDYKRAQEAWEYIGCNTFGDYHDFYLGLDCTLLVDVLYNAQKQFMKTHRLDLLRYVTLPGFSWDAMLLHTQAEIELISDPEMLALFEQNIRGGVSQIGSKRHAKANAPWLPEYDETKETSEMLYVDANNLYGNAMQSPLPYNDFKWHDFDKDKNPEEVIKELEEAGTAYVVEADWAYPEELHDHPAHFEWPLAPQNMVIGDDLLTDFYMKTWGDLKTPEGKKIRRSKVPKLVTTLLDKTKYATHHSTTKLYMQRGLVIKKIHRIVTFTEKDFMKSYIDLNTTLRKSAKNEFEVMLFKLCNNAVYGKTMECVRRRKNFKLVCTEMEYLKQVSRAGFRDCVDLYEDTPHSEQWGYITQTVKSVTVLDKPVQIGFSILEISKKIMTGFFHDFSDRLTQEHGLGVRLLMSDTDSVFCEVTGQKNPIMSVVYKNRDLFDLSKLPKSSPYYDATNRKVPGKFSLETAKDIKEFAGIAAKHYCYTLHDDDAEYKNHVVAKGVSKAQQKKMTMQMYTENVYEQHPCKFTAKKLQSFKHKIFTIKYNKKSMNTGSYDKRWLTDLVNSVPIGYHKLRK